MRIVVDVQMDDDVVNEARDRNEYPQLLKDMAAELHEMVEHQWDSPEGWFRISYIGSHAAPKELLTARK